MRYWLAIGFIILSNGVLQAYGIKARVSTKEVAPEAEPIYPVGYKAYFKVLQKEVELLYPGSNYFDSDELPGTGVAVYLPNNLLLAPEMKTGEITKEDAASVKATGLTVDEVKAEEAKADPVDADPVAVEEVIIP